MSASLTAFLLAVAAAIIGSAAFDKRENTVLRGFAVFCTLVVLTIMIAIVISF